VSVYVTSYENTGVMQQPYAEQRVIQVPNRYKFLSFHEDCRPPYRGTWSKPRSSLITGKNPFGKDTTHLDYDIDSEAEWEEGDEEEGEDCDGDDDDMDEEEDKFDAEEGDTRVYNYHDGWLAQDDDLGFEDEEDDEETKALRRRKLDAASNVDGGAFNIDPKARNNQRYPLHNTISVIAPLKGGIPLLDNEGVANDDQSSLFGCCVQRDPKDILKSVLEGINPQDAMSFATSHKGHVLMPSITLCLDAFPPPETTSSDEKKKDVVTASSNGNASGTKGPSSREMNKEDMIAFVKFVHGCTLESKTKIVEELRTSHPNVTSSRAQAQRKLDSIASKRRLANGGGVIWEIKKEILESLGMEELLKKSIVPEPTSDQPPPVKKMTQVKKMTPTRPVSPGPEPGTSSKIKETENKPTKKRANPGVSKASANLFASYLIKKRKVSSK